MALEGSSNDEFYLGLDSTFNTLYVDIATAGIGVTLSAQYYSSSWSALSISDNTSNLTTDGTITFTAPSDWTQTAVNSVTRYWIRLRSPGTDITTAPTAYSVSPTTGNRFYVYGQASDTAPAIYVNDKGYVGFGTTSSPSYRLEVLENTANTPQMSIVSDSSNHTEFYVDSTGDLSVGLTGSGGDDIYILDENLWICSGGSFGSPNCPSISLSSNGNLVIEGDLYLEGNISFDDALTKTGSFNGFTTTETVTANIDGLITDNPVVRKVQLYISNDPTADTNINFRLSFYNSDSMTEDELIKDFYFNLTYTEIANAQWSASGTGGDCDSTAGLLKYDLVRLLGGTAENVRITAVTDSDTLAVTTLGYDHAVDTGIVKVVELTDLFQLYDADSTKEIHAKLETFSAPTASMNVAISIDLQ